RELADRLPAQDFEADEGEDDDDDDPDQAARRPRRPPGQENKQQDCKDAVDDEGVIPEKRREPPSACRGASAGPREPDSDDRHEPDENPGRRGLREEGREDRPRIARRGAHGLRLDEVVDERVTTNPEDGEDEEPYEREAQGDVAD